MLNPAIAGIENYVDLKTGYRNQWQGIEGAPETGFLSVHTPVGKKFGWDNATSFSGSGDNPMSRSYIQDYQASEPHHGIGLIAVFDKAGPINRTNAGLTYAYHLGLAPKLNLSVGVLAGLTNVSVDHSKIITGSSEPDAAVAANISNQFSPDLGAGIWLYSPRVFVGISGQQLLRGNLLSSSSEQSVIVVKKVPHFFATVGYKLFLSEDIALIPSLLMKKAGPAAFSLDLNSKVAFKDKFWIGGSYRNKDSFSAMAGFYLNHLINVGYSYDFTTSELQKVSGGSHEIILSFLLNNRFRVTCPQKNW